MPISYITQETPFILNETQTMILGADDPVRDDVAITGQRLLSQTDHYWQHDFTRSLALPFEWQRAVIRAAITLKLCTFEETGAVLAAPTTSIPEHAGSQRNWDYRYCWLRDSYFVIEALNRLGATRTMEGYIDFILNATALDLDTDKNGAKDIQPLYGISMERDLIETEAEHLSGYRGMGPVRIGNKAYEQDQHDVYGSLILASMQSFFDERLHRIANIEDFYRLEQIGELAAKKYDQPDAGIWEFRGISRVHTFSAVMCWTACDRLSRIAKHLDLHDRADHWRNTADDMHAEIMDRAWNEKINSFSESFGGSDLDASLLLLHELDFIAPEDAKFIATVEAIEQNLMKNGLLFRYVREDDFGEPDTAFTICTFWFIDALHAIGRHQDARQMFERMLELRNPVGLLSEDLDFKTHELWGNFPQTYSMVGLINSAMRLSKEWTDMI
jgi:GH15 family glucan-1,4-alpha-glucosidase